MPTSARKRRVPDVLRLGMALAQPGIDPRTWVAAGRVDTDPASYHWDPQLGWVVDVTLAGGSQPAPTRAMVRGGEYLPPAAGSEVVGAFPAGETDESPVLVGSLCNGGGDEAPTSVNGLPILPGLYGPGQPVSTPASVSPFDTEIKVSPHSRREEFGGDVHRQSEAETILAPLIKLTTETPTQAFIRGTDYLADEASLYTNLAAQFAVLAVTCAAPANPTLAPLGASFTEIAKLFTSAAAKSASYASTKIVGE